MDHFLRGPFNRDPRGGEGGGGAWKESVRKRGQGLVIYIYIYMYTGDGGIEKIHVFVHRASGRNIRFGFMPNYVKRDTWSEYEYSRTCDLA